MKMMLSCPSKTFLLGEYAVLDSGEALIMQTEPRFELWVDLHGQGRVRGIHPASPAGQWLRQNKLPVQKIDMVFSDPHRGRGGFGASSAQFLLVNGLTNLLKNTDAQNLDINVVHRSLRQLTTKENGRAPSGADVLAQYVGGICEIDIEDSVLRKRKWPFLDFDVVIVPTGNKLATHEHLDKLGTLNTSELTWIYHEAISALDANNEEAFICAINDYHAELQANGLVCENTEKIISQLAICPFVHAAKGCGAMGSDAVIVMIREESRPELNAVLKKLNLTALADLQHVSTGYQVATDVEMNSLESSEVGDSQL